jgi:threonine/homoserine/homoserine lactone efflux protein
MLTHLAAFTGAAVLVALAPGPSTVVILRASLRSRRAGTLTAAGNELGVLLWGVAAAAGLSALLVASRVAYDGLRIAGAAVLVVFGIRALRAARRTAPPAVPDVADAGEGGWSSVRRGLVTNLANPKAGVFAVSFLPQFVPASVGTGLPLAAFLLLLAVWWTLIDLAWYLTVVTLAGAARRALGRPAVRRRLDQASGIVLVGLGARLAAETR